MQYKAFVPAFATELKRAQTHDYEIGLALLSVDAFRKYLDTYGIDEAHALLAEVVSAAKEELRDMDFIARFSADQFILCLSGLTSEETQETLSRIASTVTDKVLGRGDIAVTLVTGSLHLGTEMSLSETVQNIISALGKKLVEAKNRAARSKKA